MAGLVADIHMCVGKSVLMYLELCMLWSSSQLAIEEEPGHLV